MNDVHRLARLGVHLEDSPNGGFMVHHNSKLSLVVEMMYMKYRDLLMQLKQSVLIKFNESISKEGMV